MAVVAGPDPEELGDALEVRGVSVARIDGAPNRPTLEEGGISEADLFVLTNVGHATAIAIALDLAADLRVVVYTRESLPEFAKGQADLLVDPALLDPETVAEEIV